MQSEKLFKTTANIFSWIFHPLLMPTFGILILLFSESYISFMPGDVKKAILLLVVFGTFILPALLIPVFLLRGVIHQIQMDDRRERLFPMAITTVFYILTLVLFIRIPVFQLLHSFILGCLVSVIIGFIISIRWKISTHMIGIGGLIAMIISFTIKMNVNLLGLLLLSLLIAGIAGSARLYLKAHDQSQVYAGFLTGFAVMSVVMAVW